MMHIDSLSLPADSKCSVYLLSTLCSHIHSFFNLKGHIILLWKETIVNWILHITGTDFQRQMSAYEFQVFFTIGINSLHPSKMLYDLTEIYIYIYIYICIHIYIYIYIYIVVFFMNHLQYIYIYIYIYIYTECRSKKRNNF